MTSRLMSDAEIRRRKRAQGHVSQTTGALGLAALGGTMAASRGGRNTLRKIPKLKGAIAKPPPKDPNRDRIKGAVTPLLATSAGLGGVSAFNFAAYTNAESRKRKQLVTPVKKELGMLEMGYFGEEGRPVKLPEIKVPIEKAWSPSAGNFDSETNRKKRAGIYEAGSLVGAGTGAAYAGRHGVKAVKEAKKIKPTAMSETVTRKGPSGGKLREVVGGAHKSIKLKQFKGALGHGGKAAAGTAAAGAGIGAATVIRRKKESGSWQPYSKRDTTSAFGISHDVSYEWTAP